MKHRDIPVVATIIGFGVLMLIWCTDSGCQKETGVPPQVILQGARGAEVVVQVEVASDPNERERGLMFRTELAENAGMLFVYPSEAPLSFWMKNTYLPLDMIFINDTMRIVGVVENAQPLTLEAHSVTTPARYVLEVNGLFVRRHGISPGSRVRFKNIAN
jgi:uncharacterized membrane protein (UPF0127 family)